MQATRTVFLGAALLVLGNHAALGDATDEQKARWFVLPLHVESLPANGELVPLSCALDFTALLEQLKVQGAVDTHVLRLFRLEAADRKVEEPIQFSATPQPRPKGRQLLPDTPPTVSYVAEQVAGKSPGQRVAGTLTWSARGDSQGRARYLLRFRVPRAGRFLQVPYPPHELKAVDADGRATPARWFPVMQIRPQWPLDGAVHLYAGGQLVTSYHLGPTSIPAGPAAFTSRRPFLYPVNGPDGVGLTEFGKTHDPTGSHAHHYSLWVAHASVDGHDFWSEKGGVIVHKQLELMQDGPVFCRLVQRTAWVFAGTELLHERRTVTLYHTPERFRLLDIDLKLSAVEVGKPVTFGKTSFGFLAVRVAPSMSVFDGGGEIRNARGDRNERGAHLQHAEWIDQAGPIAPGKWGGVALLDHPDNPNYPTGWHCRNDGWAGAAFNLDRPYTLQPGQQLRLRYRVYLHRGDATSGAVARQFEAYRARPTVRAGEPAAAQ